METTENKFSWLKNSVSLKITVIGIIILLMLIPSGLIKNLMNERQYRLKESFNEVTSKWGGRQEINGLVITVPCIETIGKGEKKTYYTRYLHILPDQLNVTGNISPEKLHRGIFNVLVYNTKLNINGWFDPASLPDYQYSGCEILWDKAKISLGITDPKGINKNILIKWNSKDINVVPGIENCRLIDKGVHFSAKINPKEKYNFSFQLDINGSGLLQIVPVGKETNVHLSSIWEHPQFDGAYLPKNRNINDKGFIADWTVLEHNREFPQIWFDNSNVYQSSFGVELIEPVDIYQKSIRAVKYSMLFIILTFLVFLFSELILNKKAHPIQYIMVGAALCVFFSLLIALSEHIHFNLAYIIASVTIISMISLFSMSVFQNTKISIIVSVILVLLFSFLFVILQLMDYSLIIGNIGLVIVLAIIMYVSRKIDWYKEKENK